MLQHITSYNSPATHFCAHHVKINRLINKQQMVLINLLFGVKSGVHIVLTVPGLRGTERDRAKAREH